MRHNSFSGLASTKNGAATTARAVRSRGMTLTNYFLDSLKRSYVGSNTPGPLRAFRGRWIRD
jgi:hypothetical protein